MKNIITHLAALLIISLSISSCDSGNEDKPVITGEWKTVERTIRTNDSALDTSMNYAFEEDTKENDTTRSFTELNVKTTTRKKDTEGTSGLIKEVTETYIIKGDSIYIEELKGGTRISKYLVSTKVLTTYSNITSASLRKMAADVGIDPNRIPDGVTGELKVKEIR
ncbi:MAG: hypothetical protein LBU84_14870 [Prevotella sp.]|jgi:hypothetical protein|nr:hypothetical protein [Prevotella sp.]